MLLTLIVSILPALAHVETTGKYSNEVFSPDTYVNLGQFQAEIENNFNKGYRGLNVPLESASHGYVGSFGNALTNAPLSNLPFTATRPLANYENLELNQIPLITSNGNPLPYPYYNSYTNNQLFGASKIASPELNFEVGKLVNIGQSGNF